MKVVSGAELVGGFIRTPQPELSNICLEETFVSTCCFDNCLLDVDAFHIGSYSEGSGPMRSSEMTRQTLFFFLI